MRIQKLAKNTMILLGAATLAFSPAINSIALGTFMGAIQAHAAEAGQGYSWAQEGEVWKVKDGAGNYLVSDWFRDATGTWYYLGADGVMQTGLIHVNEHYYYLGTDGKMVTVDGVYNGVNLVFNKDVTSPTYGEVVSGAQEMLAVSVGSTANNINSNDSTKSVDDNKVKKPNTSADYIMTDDGTIIITGGDFTYTPFDDPNVQW